MTKYFTVEQIAEMLQVHWQTVLTYIRKKELPALKLGKAYRISESDLNKFLESKRIEGSK